MTSNARHWCLSTISRVLLPLLLLAPVGPLYPQRAPSLQISEPPKVPDTLQLVQRTRIGSLSRDADAFGRVAYVALRRNGDVEVADDQSHRVSVFGAGGQLKRQIGRQGQAPGEFELPWLIAILSGDSVAVWDAALARVSVFSPSLAFVRSFSLPPTWVLHSLRELPNGRLLASALDLSTRKALRVLTREGKTTTTFGEVTVPRGCHPVRIKPARRSGPRSGFLDRLQSQGPLSHRRVRPSGAPTPAVRRQRRRDVRSAVRHLT